MSTFQEVLTAVQGMRANKLTHIDTSSVQAKIDQIEWCLQALCEALIEAHPEAEAHEDEDSHPKAKTKRAHK